MVQLKALDRRDAVNQILAARRDALVVTGLGSSTYDVAAAGDHERNFYLWGAMGGAATLGLGLALAQPHVPVIVITGDGEMLMGLGSLATIGWQKPKNLTVIVLDNSRYGETGGQDSHTAHGTDLVAAARSCGIDDARQVATADDVKNLAGDIHTTGSGARFAVVRIDAAEQPRVLPPRDPTFLMTRTRRALGFEPI